MKSESNMADQGEKRKLHFKIYKEENEYWSECIELTDCYIQADNLLDLEKNAKEAAKLYLNVDENIECAFVLPFLEE